MKGSRRQWRAGTRTTTERNVERDENNGPGAEAALATGAVADGAVGAGAGLRHPSQWSIQCLWEDSEAANEAGWWPMAMAMRTGDDVEENSTRWSECWRL